MCKNAEIAAVKLKALAHPARLMILCQLVDQEKSVGDLYQDSSLSQSAFSQHLAVLRKQNLVKTRRQTQTIFYSLAGEDSIQILQLLHKLYCKYNEIQLHSTAVP